jgi:hypothetical protein
MKDVEGRSRHVGGGFGWMRPHFRWWPASRQYCAPFFALLHLSQRIIPFGTDPAPPPPPPPPPPPKESPKPPISTSSSIIEDIKTPPDANRTCANRHLLGLGWSLARVGNFLLSILLRPLTGLLFRFSPSAASGAQGEREQRG